MIITKSGDKLCGYIPATSANTSNGCRPPAFCTATYGHGGDSHHVNWALWEVLVRDGYAWQPNPPKPTYRPLAALRDSGLLWLINATTFHPRGYALALHYGHDQGDEVIGWSLVGDGTEPFMFDDDTAT